MLASIFIFPKGNSICSLLRYNEFVFFNLYPYFMRNLNLASVICNVFVSKQRKKMCTKYNTMWVIFEWATVKNDAVKNDSDNQKNAMQTILYTSISKFFCLIACSSCRKCLSFYFFFVMPLGSNHTCNAYKNVKDHQHNCNEQKWKSLTLTMANSILNHMKRVSKKKPKNQFERKNKRELDRLVFVIAIKCMQLTRVCWMLCMDPSNW